MNCMPWFNTYSMFSYIITATIKGFKIATYLERQSDKRIWWYWGSCGNGSHNNVDSKVMKHLNAYLDQDMWVEWSNSNSASPLNVICIKSTWTPLRILHFPFLGRSPFTGGKKQTLTTLQQHKWFIVRRKSFFKRYKIFAILI